MLVVFICIISCGTKSPEQKKQSGFYITKPENWKTLSDDKLISNLQKFDISEEKMSEILKNHNGSAVLAIYMKYDPKEYPGLIPTIQVNMRKSGAVNYEGFKKVMVNSIEQFKQVFDNFTIVEGPFDIEVDGHKTFWFMSTFDMKTQAGDVWTVRSWTYGIYNGNHFYQLNFSDEVNGPDDCAALYKEVLKSVKLN